MRVGWVSGGTGRFCWFFLCSWVKLRVVVIESDISGWLLKGAFVWLS